MAPVRARRRSGTSRLVQVLLGISVPALAVLVLVVVLGRLEIPFLAGSPVLAWTRGDTQTGPDAPPPGTIALPLVRAPIEAYTAVSREHYFDMATGTPSVIRLPKDSVSERMVTMDDVANGRLNGRVLKRDKRAGYVFTWDDFLPEGSRSGIVAGIPPGKRGLWVEVSKIHGLSDLRTGDRFDIVSAQATETAPAPRSDVVSSLEAARLASGTPQLRPKTPAPRVELVVESGQVVVPERTRTIATTSSSLMNGPRTSQRPVREVLIAIEPTELAALAAAIAADATLLCAPRSGHPDESADAPTELGTPVEASIDPDAARFTTVEIIEGDARRHTATRRADHDG